MNKTDKKMDYLDKAALDRLWSVYSVKVKKNDSTSVSTIKSDNSFKPEDNRDKFTKF